MSFRIGSIEIFEVPMELRTAHDSSSHSVLELRHPLVRMKCNGLVGWGECPVLNDPYYVGETPETSWAIFQDFLVPLTLGATWSTPDDFIALYDKIQENTFARYAFEAAAWDIFAQARGQSLAQAFGLAAKGLWDDEYGNSSTVDFGQMRERIDVGVSLGLGENNYIPECLEKGYKRIKLKITPDRAEQILREFREDFPDVILTADANGAYQWPKDRERLLAFDKFKLDYLEEPLRKRHFSEFADLAKTMKTPICYDESVRSFADALTAIEFGGAGVIAIKPGRVGGVLEAIRIHNACLAKDIPVWHGGMYAYGIGRAGDVALSSLPGFTLPGDVSGSDRYFKDDLITPIFRVEKGQIEVPTKPGLGVEVDEDRIRKTSLRTLEGTLTPGGALRIRATDGPVTRTSTRSTEARETVLNRQVGFMDETPRVKRVSNLG
ncbi:MAG TPA: o-succinylbenzoate synthase [Candidatus Baltobacteraceae bacterium]|jgi:O-succinylbenzoate synthase|nr:o-succinylbenzoate synthase [Candidatus Baltobacteraceae bacterium]